MKESSTFCFDDANVLYVLFMSNRFWCTNEMVSRTFCWCKIGGDNKILLRSTFVMSSWSLTNRSVK